MYRNGEIGWIISVGDKIPCNRFGRIHSRFEQVLNFHLGELIISIVTPDIPPGPFRIVLDNYDLKTISEVKLTLDDMVINHSIILSRSAAKAYKSAWKPKEGNVVISPRNIRILRTLLLDCENDKTLFYILYKNPLSKDLSEFEKELYIQFDNAHKKLIANDLLNAVAEFKGKGYGLTPAGDDFNTGLLLGLTIRQKCEQKDLSKMRSAVYSNALGKNLMVNTFLLQAYHGWYNEDWKNLFSALVGQIPDIEIAVKVIMSQGETSGIDTLTGFLAAWEIEL